MKHAAPKPVVCDVPAAPPCPRWLAIVAAAFPTILALFFWPTLQSAFLLPKAALLVLGSALLLVAAAATRAPLPRARTGIEQAFLLSAGALLLIACLSAILSNRKELAPQTLLFLAAGPTLMAATAVLMRDRLGWLIRGIAVANVAIALLALANHIGLDVFQPFGLHADYSDGRMRVAATLGNPNFVAAFLAGSAPAVLFLCFKTTRRAWPWRVALALSLVAVWSTESRLGIAALAVAIFTPLLIRADRRWIALALVAFFAVAGVLINHHNPRRFSTAAAGRRMIWRASLHEGIHLFGDGPGTFAYYYPQRLGSWFVKHNDPAALPFADAQTHAHNDLIESRDETGWLGGLALLSVLVCGILVLVAKRKSCEHASYAFAGVLAIVVTSLFDFPLHRAEMWALLWLWLSFVFLHEPVLAKPMKQSALPLAFLAVPIAAISILPTIASYYVHEGLAFEAQSSDREAAAEYRRALRFDRTNPDANFYLARALANSGDSQNALAQTKVAEYWVDEPDLYELQARIYAQMGQPDSAISTLREALRRFPYARNLVETELEFSSPAQTQP